MKKTLLLCFIHGFKGGDDTFGRFPEDLRALLSHDLPKLDVRAITYPQFETRGDLAECVGRFKEWLLEKVIDIEVDKHTPSPTVDPSVHTILIGHSMGGIVAADTLLSLTSEHTVSQSTSPTTPTTNTDPAEPLNSMMFPYIAAVLAFDTPYLGISPGVVAHGAEEHYNTASAALTQLSALTGGFWGSKAAAGDTSDPKKEPVAALPASSPSSVPIPAWQKWGKIAGLAVAGAAVAGGSVAAYRNRETITSGWTWVGSHLEFVGCLMRGEELQKRSKNMVEVSKGLGVGWANIYSRLGKKAMSKDGTTMVGSVIGNSRTFCNLPKKESREFWQETVNDAAGDEINAHMMMFFPKDNPVYFALGEQAKKLIVNWTTTNESKEWYESSTEDMEAIEHGEL